MYFNSW